MKKRLFVLLPFLVLLFSCNTKQYKAPYYVDTTFIDYSYLMEKGLFVTESNSVNFSYTPIGSVYVEIRSGYTEEKESQSKLKLPKKKELEDNLYGRQKEGKEKVKHNNYVVATIDDALNLLYEQTLDKGANGVINLKVVPVSPVLKEAMIISGEGYAISGMAIKR